ncbi:MAG: hypothetical protein HC939_17100 [Pleurocapsa sp. SU_5_0]|nr:hypothetical protein [Pleurocapsa sp. SU_5_0]
MQLIKHKTIKFSLGFILTILCSSLIVIKSQFLTSTQQIIVDVNHVIADYSSNPIGMNLNFLLDTEGIIKPAQKLHIGSLRYPMGEIADYYLFDPERPNKPKISIKNSHLWFANFANSDATWKHPLTFDRFIDICYSLNAEPFIVIGIDALAYQSKFSYATFDEVLQAAVDWVKYANIIQGYKIKHWEIGNENDLPNLHLNWTAEKYAETVVKFSRAMKQVDPSIKIGVNGMTGIKWWERVMPIVKDDVDFLVTHQYSPIANYEQWNSNNWNYTNNVEIANQAIEKYNPNLKLNVTENSSFNPGQSHANNVWKMLHNFEMLGNTLCFNRLEYLHFWISRWFSPNSYTNDTSAFNHNYKLMPMAYSLKIWGNYLKKQMVYSTKKLRNIRSWASYDREDNSLNLFLLNKGVKPHLVTIQLNNYVKNIKNSDR